MEHEEWAEGATRQGEPISLLGGKRVQATPSPTALPFLQNRTSPENRLDSLQVGEPFHQLLHAVLVEEHG